MAEWQRASVMQLQDEGVLLVEDGNHGEYRPRKDEFAADGVAFIRAADLQNGRVEFGTASKINETARRRIVKGIGAPGDVILTHKGTVGRLARASGDAPPFVCSPQTTFWRSLDPDRVDQGYLYSYLRSPSFGRQLQSRSAETDMAPYVSLTAQRQFELALPPIDVQRAIAAIIGALDDKVELNQHMEETLEELAKAIFRSWFLDFDPVWAKAEGRDSELPTHIAKLFPDTFESSELGELPTGWRVARLRDDFQLVMGQSPPGETYNTDGRGLPFYQGSRDFGSRYPSHRVFCTSPTRLAEPRDVLISVRAPIGDTNVAVETCAIGRGVAAIRHRCPSFALYTVLGLHTVLESYESDGTVFASIGKSSLSDLRVVSPPPAVLDAFETYSGALDLRIAKASRESELLTETRDNLLPKLVSGELQVRDAERFVTRIL